MTSEQFYRIFDEELGYDVKATTSCDNLIGAISKYIIPALNRNGYTLKNGWNNCMTLSSLYNYLTPYNDRSFSNKAVASTTMPSISQRRNVSVSSLLSKRATILQRIDSINDSIERGNYSLSIALEDLNDIRPCINIENHWYGAVKNDTIRESILATHENLAHYIQRCGAALRSTNDNLAHTLELVQILAVFEADLYRTLNREAESKKSLKEKVEEWCNQSNIKDETVKALLAASFEKAYILKDRLYDIKEELTQRIDEITEVIESDQRYSTLKEELLSNIKNLEDKFQSDVRFSKLKADLTAKIENLFNRFESDRRFGLIKDELTASINDLDKRFKSDPRFAELKAVLTNRIDELFSRFESDERFGLIKDELSASINDLDQRFKSDPRFAELKDNLTQRIEEIRDKLGYLSSELEKLDKNQNQIRLCFDENWHKHEQAIMSMQQTINQLETKLSERNSDSKKNKIATFSISAIVAVVSSLLTYIVLQAI